ncbi:MAG: class I SAM-dependent methyltransferase [Clostridiales bacterium]|jgi:SAM-dependent methyltransferase|nr:class I SAM-dependent methyltransferase [Clostridiales bacterium]
MRGAKFDMGMERDMGMELELDIEKIKSRYSSLAEIWPEDDKWHSYTHRFTQGYLERAAAKMAVGAATKLLNVGSAGNEYGILAEHYHVDIVFDKIAALPRACEASAEALPFGDGVFDGCLCVGSVIDYCDASRALPEFSRVLRDGGFLIFDFEQTRTLQLLGTKDYGRDACVADTFYCGETERLRLYSPGYIRGLLDGAGLAVAHREYCHILSPLAYRLCRDENRAARLAVLDSAARRVPFLGKNSCNVIMTCQKIGASHET